MSMSLAETLRALGDPSRLRVLSLLRSMELTVGELAQVLGQSQPRVSQHIKALLEVELIERRKEGNWVFITLARAELVEPIFALIDAWSKVEGPEPWFAADEARLKAVRADRAAEAQRYFARYAARWDELRSTHVPDAEVDAAVIRALAGHRIGRLFDIGTGTGRMLELLSREADHAIGIDRSPEMLRIARAKMEEGGVPAELRQGDMYALGYPDEAADTIVFHQVLHYAHHPEAVIAEAARLLAPEGRLVIVDVAPHERDDFRDRFAHARLGFRDDVVVKWLKAAGLSARVAEHLTGGELTITLWVADKPNARRLKVVQ